MKVYIFSTPLKMWIPLSGGWSRSLYYLNLPKDLKRTQAWEQLEYWKEHGF